MQENRDYYIIERDEWNAYLTNELSNRQVTITDQQLERITSLNDVLSRKDAFEVYKPLTELVDIYKQNYEELTRKRDRFLGISRKMPPFIIGIAGGVAVGKSTAARLLKIFLSQVYPDLNVDLVTTDGFLYSTEELERRNILNRKGFPESYNMQKLISFLKDIKNNVTNIQYPTYSHEVYDIIPGEWQELVNPDIVIVEGINILQFPSNTNIYVSDFFDLSIYVDADADLIEKWFYQRFELLVDKAKNKPDDYYHRFSKMDKPDAIYYAHKVWQEINLVNLEENILPTRNNADIVIHKENNHKINQLWLKKY